MARLSKRTVARRQNGMKQRASMKLSTRLKRGDTFLLPYEHLMKRASVRLLASSVGDLAGLIALPKFNVFQTVRDGEADSGDRRRYNAHFKALSSRPDLLAAAKDAQCAMHSALKAAGLAEGLVPRARCLLSPKAR